MGDTAAIAAPAVAAAAAALLPPSEEVRPRKRGVAAAVTMSTATYSLQRGCAKGVHGGGPGGTEGTHSAACPCGMAMWHGHSLLCSYTLRPPQPRLLLPFRQQGPGLPGCAATKRAVPHHPPPTACRQRTQWCRPLPPGCAVHLAAPPPAAAQIPAHRTYTAAACTVGKRAG